MKVYRITPRPKKISRFRELSPATYKQQLKAVAADQKKRSAIYARNMVVALSEHYVNFWRDGIIGGTLDLMPRLSTEYRNFLSRIGADPDGPELFVRGQIVAGVVSHPVVQVGKTFTANIGVSTSAMFTPLGSGKKKRPQIPLGVIITVHELGSDDGIVPPRPSFRNAMNQWAAPGSYARKLALRFMRS